MSVNVELLPSILSTVMSQSIARARTVTPAPPGVASFDLRASPSRTDAVQFQFKLLEKSP
jgi:hypothetical protein